MPGTRVVDFSVNEVVKTIPSLPPQRGETILVDGIRSTVAKIKVAWDGPHWTIHRLVVKDKTE
jgi:hypothetical protein